jgi:nitrogen fixation protein
MPGGEIYRPKQKSGIKKTFHWGGSILLAEAWFTSIGH